MAFTIPPLPYDYGSLEPHIDTRTMTIHHDKHHATYVTNLNNSVVGTEFENWSIEKLLGNISQIPAELSTAVQNNGGGHANHSLFWSIMSPNAGGEPTGPLASAINTTFESFNSFKEAFADAGTKRFGRASPVPKSDQNNHLLNN